MGVASPLAGCARTIDGAAEPAVSVVDALPDEEEIASSVGNALDSYSFAPAVGGLEIFPDGFRDSDDASPIECIGVTDTMTRWVYEQVPVTEAARESYFNLNPSVGTSGLDAAVVHVANADAAEQLYQTFLRQWQDCDGTTVVKRLPGSSSTELSATVSDVRVDGTVMSATVRTRSNRTNSESVAQRALGVRADRNRIVDVSLAITGLGQQSASADDGAVRLVEVMLAKT